MVTYDEAFKEKALADFTDFPNCKCFTTETILLFIINNYGAVEIFKNGKHSLLLPDP